MILQYLSINYIVKIKCTYTTYLQKRRLWLQRFKSGHFDVSAEKRPGGSERVENNESKDLLDENPV